MPVILVLATAARAQETDLLADVGEGIVLPTLNIDAAADDGMVPLSSAIATKTATPIERIPQAVSIITRNRSSSAGRRPSRRRSPTPPGSSPRPGARTRASRSS